MPLSGDGAVDATGATGGFESGTVSLACIKEGAAEEIWGLATPTTGGTKVTEDEGGTRGIGGFNPPVNGGPERTGLGGSLRGGSLTGPGGIGASLGLSDAGESFRGSLIMNEVGRR